MAILGATATKAAARRLPRVPSTMRAAAIDRFGSPAGLTLHVLPVPEHGPHDVLMALYSAGVGVWDASVRDGSWRPYGTPKFPLIPGTDGAGVIVEKGARVRGFEIGERVYGVDFSDPQGGFYAEFKAIDDQHVARVPKPLDMLQAGAAPVPGLTALQGIDDHLHVRREEYVLIFGATGSVGTLAIQFAKRHHARVIVTASGGPATALVKKLGANSVFDPRSDTAVEQLTALAPDGIDAVLALAGGDDLEKCLDLVNKDGRVAFPNGVEPEPKRRPKFRLISYNAAVGPQEFARLEQATIEARLHVPIAAAYPLAEAAKAHERLEAGHILGRIVLRIRRMPARQ
jgi:NADPH2:quinone reductase